MQNNNSHQFMYFTKLLFSVLFRILSANKNAFLYKLLSLSYCIKETKYIDDMQLKIFS